MAEPIVFISHNRIKEGLLERFLELYRDSVPRTEAGKPATLVQIAYISEDKTRVDIIRLFPDPAAMDLQLQGADERSKVVYQTIEPAGVEIYGTPSEFSMQMLRKVAGSGIPVTVSPRFAGGFVRPGAGGPAPASEDGGLPRRER